MQINGFNTSYGFTTRLYMTASSLGQIILPTGSTQVPWVRNLDGFLTESCVPPSGDTRAVAARCRTRIRGGQVQWRE